MAIKLVIFDLDGVLIDAREIHYEALNEALVEHGCDPISYPSHLASFDGLSTRQKLRNLRITPEVSALVFASKQRETLKRFEAMGLNPAGERIFGELHDRGIRTAVASNCVRNSVDAALYAICIYPDITFSNEDVADPKPSPEIYLRCMIQAGVGPHETVIVEDSRLGREAARASGARVVGITEPSELSLDRILDSSAKVDARWDGGDMNVLIPMAGKGTRFTNAGYTFPKPLIDVAGKPMIQAVVENLNIKARHIFIVQNEHKDSYCLESMLRLVSPGCEVVEQHLAPQGAACSTLLADGFFDNDKPLLIANSDQIVDWDVGEFLWSMSGAEIDAGIATFRSTHPKWSFARVEDGFVVEVAEKRPISDLATVGIYYWKRGSDYVKYARQMIEANDKVNGEFYVCPVFNWAIKDGLKVKTFDVKEMHGLGTSEDLQEYLRKCD